MLVECKYKLLDQVLPNFTLHQKIKIPGQLGKSVKGSNRLDSIKEDFSSSFKKDLELPRKTKRNKKNYSNHVIYKINVIVNCQKKAIAIYPLNFKESRGMVGGKKYRTKNRYKKHWNRFRIKGSSLH